MKNKINENEQLARMKSLMNYGLKTEGKEAQYSSVEYKKLAADGKVYGIVREGTKYYIKSAPNKSNLVKENFDYIGGFRNRKDNEYSNFALAQKQFDLKMMSLKEAASKNDFSIESWDLNKKEKVVTEATDKMKGEILRERQIMKNAMNIQEKKGCEGIDCDITKTQKDNIKSETPKTGNAEDAVEHEKPELPKEMKEEKEVLAWHDSNGNPKGDTYLDKSHGTEIGSSAPFDDAEGKQITDNGEKEVKTSEAKNGVVEEGESMHDKCCQNTPKPGVGEVGDTAPFDGEKGKDITESVDDDNIEDEPSDDDVDIDTDIDGDDDIADDDFGAEDELDSDDDLDIDDNDIEEPSDDVEGDDDVYSDDIESRIDAVEDLLSKIAYKLGVSDDVDDSEYTDDDDLFTDDEPDDFGAEDEIDDEVDLDMPMESRRYGNEDVQIFETRAYKNAMRNRRRVNEGEMTPFTDNGRVPSGNMNKLDDFGKHPAYQKKVMSLPPKDKKEFQGYYDMNDDSVMNDDPYGEKIGDGAPFEITPEKIQNAISEAISRLKKNLAEGKRPTKLEIPMDSSLGDGSDAPMMGGDMPPMDDGSMDGMGEDLGNDQMDGMGDQASDAGLPPMDDGDSDGINDDGADGNADDNSNPEDNELMDIINSLSIEDKAAVEKYAKSMVDDDKSSASDDMPMESRVSRFKNLVDETINSFLYDDDEDDRVERLPKEYKSLSNPFKSPYE